MSDTIFHNCTRGVANEIDKHSRHWNELSQVVLSKELFTKVYCFSAKMYLWITIYLLALRHVSLWFDIVHFFSAHHDYFVKTVFAKHPVSDSDGIRKMLKNKT